MIYASHVLCIVLCLCPILHVHVCYHFDHFVTLKAHKYYQNVAVATLIAALFISSAPLSRFFRSSGPGREREPRAPPQI